MSDKETNKLYCCKKCKKELTIENFYPRKGYHVDSYCKKCRSDYNWAYYNVYSRKKVKHVVITQVEDPKLRLEMVRAVHAKVQEMVEKNQRRRMEEEGKRELRNMKGGKHGQN